MKSVQPASCPMEALLRVITGPWTIYILWVLSEQGPQRFGATKRLVPGISTRVLTERLRMLEHLRRGLARAGHDHPARCHIRAD